MQKSVIQIIYLGPLPSSHSDANATDVGHIQNSSHSNANATNVGHDVTLLFGRRGIKLVST